MASKRGRGFQAGNSNGLRPAYIQQKELARARQAAAKSNVNKAHYYQCECCLQTFEKTKTDEEAMKEAKELFPNDDLSDAAVVCDVCFRAIIAKVGEELQ